MKQTAQFVALIGLVLLSACTDQGTTMTRITPTAQMASIKWDEAVAAQETVKVNNTSLIFMR